MGVSFTQADVAPADATAVVIGAFAGDPAPPGVDEAYARACGFEGKRDQAVTVPAERPGTVTVLVGLGSRPDFDAPAARRAGAVAARAVKRHGSVALHPIGDEHLALFVEGYVLGRYAFVRYRAADEGTVTD